MEIIQKGKSLPSRGVWIEIGLKRQAVRLKSSLPSRGVWIEILYTVSTKQKSLSLPSRGVWIEIKELFSIDETATGHSPHGECGLKLIVNILFRIFSARHSPHGECGLKLSESVRLMEEGKVTPLTGSVD